MRYVLTGIFQVSILERMLDSGEVPQEKKKSEQNPALLFLAYLLTEFLSSCIPKSAVHAKGCHRVRLSVSNAAQASC